MLVSVPLLFLHVKKFLSPSEGKHTNWPRDTETKKRHGHWKQLQGHEEIAKQKQSDSFGNKTLHAAVLFNYMPWRADFSVCAASPFKQTTQLFFF